MRAKILAALMLISAPAIAVEPEFEAFMRTMSSLMNTLPLQHPAPEYEAPERTTTPDPDIIAWEQRLQRKADRYAKCCRLWETFAPWSYRPWLVDWFLQCHEAEGIPDQWYWSMVYGMANFGLRVGGTAPGRCYGPMDCKWPYVTKPPLGVLSGEWEADALLDPTVNVWCHTHQMAEYHRKTGRTGFALLRTVYYPRSPWGYHANRWAPQWRKWDAKFKECIADGYKEGKLP